MENYIRTNYKKYIQSYLNGSKKDEEVEEKIEEGREKDKENSEKDIFNIRIEYNHENILDFGFSVYIGTAQSPFEAMKLY